MDIIEENQYCKTYYSNNYSIIRIPKNPLLDEIILTKFGEIKYRVNNNINIEDKFHSFNYNYYFEGINNLNLFNNVKPQDGSVSIRIKVAQ